MKVAKLFSFLAVLILGCATVVSAASKTAPAKSHTQDAKSTTSTKATTHHMMGTVASVSDNDLVLEHTWKGKKEHTKFTLDAQTKKEGDITKGCDATVYYHMKGHERTATVVKVSAMKS